MKNIIKLLPNKFKLNNSMDLIFITKSVNVFLLKEVDNNIYIILNNLNIKEILFLIKILTANNINFYFKCKEIYDNDENNSISLIDSYFDIIKDENYHKKFNTEYKRIFDKIFLKSLKKNDNYKKFLLDKINNYSIESDETYWDYYSSKVEFVIKNRDIAMYIKNTKRRLFFNNLLF